MLKSDIQLKQDVEAELLWDPKLNAAAIAVAVDQGAVTLFGAVDTFAEKWEAEAAARRVAGVRSIAQDLTVKVLAPHLHDDTEIATAALHALTWDVSVPKEVTARVQAGSVVLEGAVTWQYQRDAAERAIRNLTGVIAVTNGITLLPRVTEVEVKQKIQAALQRQAVSDTSTILVETEKGAVTLSGHAGSWQAVADATHAAWSLPGVTSVHDHVKIVMTH